MRVAYPLEESQQKFFPFEKSYNLHIFIHFCLLLYFLVGSEGSVGLLRTLLQVERLLRPIKDRVIVELQQVTEIQYLRPRVTFDRRIFNTEMYRRNRVATFQFAPPYMDGKAFCPSTLNFLMYVHGKCNFSSCNNQALY
jgi:hypothetical protein